MSPRAVPTPTPETKIDTKPVTDLQMQSFLGYALKRAYVALETEVNQLLAAYGLRATPFAAMGIIVENPGLTQTALAAALQMERSSLVLIVDTLEQADYITRNRVEGDRRTYALVATLHGQTTFDRICQEIRAKEDLFQAELSAPDRSQLLTWLHAIQMHGAR